ncbi:MAG TPA: hypothetical protein VHY57_05800 [Rhizomicrobium sp.]|nr:hypothetical protein [Rhizomicrobium sp.]HSS12672.1 hypothetical protein [Rhizomicrobium sp.]
MSKKKLFEDIKHNPARIYRMPADVLRDRRFADAERLQILRAWRDLSPDQADAAVIDVMIAEVENRLCASDHAAE